MTHAEIIVDKDPCFEINTITREIKNMTAGKTSLMQYDHNSERFGFTMPRFVEGHDMLNCDRVEVHYLNTDGMTQEQAKGLYVVEDVALSEESEEKLTFSWLLSQNSTKYVGALTFLIRFICLEGDAKLAYAWHTSIFTGISVAKGMNNSDEIAEEYADVLNQWYMTYLKAYDKFETEYNSLKTEYDALKQIINSSVGTYATHDLVAGITCDLSVKLSYPVTVDSYTVYVGDTAITEKTAVTSAVRIAKELINAQETRVIFFNKDTEVFSTKIQQNLDNAGMLLVEI